MAVLAAAQAQQGLLSVHIFDAVLMEFLRCVSFFLC